MLLKVTIKVAEYTDREVVPQGRGARANLPAPALVLTLGTNRVVPLFDISKRHGSDVASMRLFFMKSFVGQQTDLELNSKLYWSLMTLTQQWNTVSKWW